MYDEPLSAEDHIANVESILGLETLSMEDLPGVSVRVRDYLKRHGVPFTVEEDNLDLDYCWVHFHGDVFMLWAEPFEVPTYEPLSDDGVDHVSALHKIVDTADNLYYASYHFARHTVLHGLNLETHHDMAETFLYVTPVENDDCWRPAGIPVWVLDLLGWQDGRDHTLAEMSAYPPLPMRGA